VVRFNNSLLPVYFIVVKLATTDKVPVWIISLKHKFSFRFLFEGTDQCPSIARTDPQTDLHMTSLDTLKLYGVS